MITVSILRRFFLISRRIFFDARSIVHGPIDLRPNQETKKKKKKNIKKEKEEISFHQTPLMVSKVDHLQTSNRESLFPVS